MDVSVVVLTYRSNFEKLKYTLNSIASQLQIKYEVLIADDGTQNINKAEIINYIDKIELKNVKYIWNKENKGTVKNYLDAVKASVGKYVYGISPGDCLYDEFTLRDLYEFAEENSATVCFGRVQGYSIGDNVLKLIDVSTPQIPEIYLKDKYRPIFVNTSFFFGEFIIGASYFRERTLFERYLIQIADHVKYTEDTSTSFIHIAEDGRIIFCDRYVVWYEADTGISNNKNHPLSSRMKKDEYEIEKYMVNNYKNNNLVKFKWIDSKITRIIKHPVIVANILLYKIKKTRVKKQKRGKIHKEYLEKYINNK